MTFDNDLLKQCAILAGPTASGKSAAGLVLAERTNAEIVSLDSMAIYREMDIGTAKPSPDEQRRVPHHLIDVVDPSDDFSVAEYLVAAEAACRGILDRGRVPLFVGGTGLYMRSLLRGVFEGPAASPEIRNRLESEAAEYGVEQLHQRLATTDPATAARVHPNDLRRVVRALEVAELTGRPLSEQHEQAPLPVEQRPTRVWWLCPNREWLYDRIEERVDRMMDAGLLEETRRLHDRSAGLGRTARQALGYRELIDHLEGRCSLEDAVALIKLRTRQFAKRQHTWFRNLEECRAVEIDDGDTAEAVAARLVSTA